jgi:hypothetical protein
VPIQDVSRSSRSTRNPSNSLGISRCIKGKITRSSNTTSICFNEKKQNLKKSLVNVIVSVADLTRRRNPKEIDFKTKRNWELLYRSQVLALRLSKVYKKILKSCMRIVGETQVKGLGTLSHMLKEYIVEADQEFIKKIVQILSVIPKNRTRDKIELIERLLYVRMSDFAIFPYSDRLIFSKTMTLQKYPKNTLLIMNGHCATCIFFVLSGQVEVFTLNDGCKYRVN